MNVPHPILVELYEPCNYSPWLSWGEIHGILGGFLKWITVPVCKWWHWYVELPDKAHIILGLTFGNPFLWERYSYKVGVVETLSHPLEMTYVNGVGWHFPSFGYDLNGDYPWDDLSWWHISKGKYQLPTFWNILRDKKLVKVEVGHTLPHMTPSWWLHDSYCYTTILVKETTLPFRVSCLKWSTTDRPPNICWLLMLGHISRDDKRYSFGFMCPVAWIILAKNCWWKWDLD